MKAMDVFFHPENDGTKFQTVQEALVAALAGVLADNSVTFAKMQDIATDRLIGRDTAASGDPEEISVGGGLEFTGSAGIQRSALTGDVTASAGNNGTTIANDAVTFAKFQNITDARLLGRNAGSAGDMQEIDLGTGLSFSGTTLNAGSAGGITLIASGSFPAAATLDITNIPATYAYLVIKVTGASSTVSSRMVLIQVSTNNGSSFDATAANYAYFRVDQVAGLFTGTRATLGESVSGGGIADTGDITCSLFNYQSGPHKNFIARHTNSQSSTAHAINIGCYFGSTSAIDAIRILWSGTGNFDAGTYAVYGVS
ncbi:MAG: hypothetical protein EHM35_03345 [Planctomycetaceae bacterium]|nr:MAG: hypothetical protein EHM35_03345 [Planctomycetaceae bacterium]